MPHQFTIKLDSHSDALPDLLEALAARDVDLRAIGISGIGRMNTAVLITNNDVATRAILRAGHHTFLEGEVVITAVPDQPGALAELVRYLGDAGIRLQGLSLLRWHQGKAELALSVDNPVALQRLLGSYTRDFGGAPIPGLARTRNERSPLRRSSGLACTSPSLP